MFTVLLGALFVSGTALLVLSCYFLMRQLEDQESQLADARPGQLRDAAHFRAACADPGAGVCPGDVEYQQLKLQSATEANALADIYFDAGRYGGTGPGADQADPQVCASIVHQPRNGTVLAPAAA